MPHFASSVTSAWCMRRNEVAFKQLRQGRALHAQQHCVRCCHHKAGQHSHCHRTTSRGGCGSCLGQSCRCREADQRTGALSFLQPMCQGSSARERYHAFQWSLMLRAFASWRACSQQYGVQVGRNGDCGRSRSLAMCGTAAAQCQAKLQSARLPVLCEP